MSSCRLSNLQQISNFVEPLAQVQRAALSSHRNLITEMHAHRVPAGPLQQLPAAFRSQSRVCALLVRRRTQRSRLEALESASRSPGTLPSSTSSPQLAAPRSQCAHQDAQADALEQQQAAQRRRRSSGKCCSTSAGAAVFGTGLSNDGGAQTAALPAAPWRLPLPRLRTASLTAPLTWGFMLSYLVIMLIVPISALLSKASLIPPAVFWARATEPVALSAYFVTFSMGLAACAINAVFGFMLAWVLVKYDFPGKKWVDAAVDLPFALPTSVAGLTLATVYSDDGLIGALLAKLGIHVVFNRLGVAVAMVFVSFPFVVRTMQPVLQEMEKEVEEAAWSLGASPWRTFKDVLLPPLLPPLLTGTALAFSRAIGEFGSIVIVSSNFPFKDLIAPVLIFQCLEQYDFVGATVIGTVLLLISLVMMVGVNWLQAYAQRFRK